MALRLKVVEDGECKGSGLARAGLCLADYIRASEHKRDHARLDGCGLRVAKFSDGLHNFCAQIEGSKISCHLNPYNVIARRMLLPEGLQRHMMWDVSMALFNFLLANQSFSLQIRSPNKKARPIVQRAFRVIKTIPKNYSIWSRKSIS